MIICYICILSGVWHAIFSLHFSDDPAKQTGHLPGFSSEKPVAFSWQLDPPLSIAIDSYLCYNITCNYFITCLCPQAWHIHLSLTVCRAMASSRNAGSKCTIRTVTPKSSNSFLVFFLPPTRQYMVLLLGYLLSFVLWVFRVSSSLHRWIFYSFLLCSWIQSTFMKWALLRLFGEWCLWATF